MSTEMILIEKIRTRSALWDLTTRGYHNRDISKKLWEEVEEETGIPKDAARKKWKNLRDTFRKELKNVSKRKSGSQTSTLRKSKWIHFESLLFLKDVMLPRPTNENLIIADNTESLANEEDTEHFNHKFLSDTNIEEDNSLRTEEKQCEMSPEFLDPPPPPPPTFSKQKAKRKSSQHFEFLELEKQKLSLLEKGLQHDMDDDYHFLMSFHPYVKKMPEEKKLLFRIKMQEVLFGVMYGKDYSQSTGSCRNQSLCTQMSLQCSVPLSAASSSTTLESNKNRDAHLNQFHNEDNGVNNNSTEKCTSLQPLDHVCKKE